MVVYNGRTIGTHWVFHCEPLIAPLAGRLGNVDVVFIERRLGVDQSKPRDRRGSRLRHRQCFGNDEFYVDIDWFNASDLFRDSEHH